MEKPSKNNLSGLWNTLKTFLLMFAPIILIIAGTSQAYYLSVEKANFQKQAKWLQNQSLF